MDLVVDGEYHVLGLGVVVEWQVYPAATECIVAGSAGQRGAVVVGVLRLVVAGFEHGEEEQLVLHDRAGGVEVELGPRVVVLAGGDVAGAVLRVSVLGLGLPTTRLQGELGAEVELVGTRAGHRVDHAAASAAEFDRVAAGLGVGRAAGRERVWQYG